jgi:translation initiation factor 1
MRLFEGTPFDRPLRCERCGELETQCVCPPPAEPKTPAGKQLARVSVENRKAKRQVTVIRGLLDEGDHLPELLKKLKSGCGSGGVVREGTLELQGDQQSRATELLRQFGYRVR